MPSREVFGWIVVGLAILAAVILLTWTLPAAPYTPGVKIECVDTEEERQRLEALSLQAIDEALEEHVKHLYAIWMRDMRDQPRRAQVGASQAIEAWLDARRGMAAFAPSICPVK